MFDPDQLGELRELIRAHAAADQSLLEELLIHVRGMSGSVKTIRPRAATSVALMAADGGDNKIAFNPFYLQILRVVDSAGRELLLDVVSPSTPAARLTSRQFDSDGSPVTALGRLMNDLGCGSIALLSTMMAGQSRSRGQVYRELCEWATLYDLICYRDFAVDTLIVRDGLLRSKVFAGDYFVQMYRLMQAAIDRIHRVTKRRIWLVGLAKRTEVLEYYKLAMSLGGVFGRGAACFVAVPRAMQERVYRWSEYIRAVESSGEAGEAAKYNIGEMYFVRFGNRSGDPIWTVDLLASQVNQDQAVFGYLLADAVAGFPIPLYPHCIQQADAHSRVADFDLDIIEDALIDAVRHNVGPESAAIIDSLRLASDVAARRYE